MRRARFVRAVVWWERRGVVLAPGTVREAAREGRKVGTRLVVVIIEAIFGGIQLPQGCLIKERHGRRS